jgi:subtilase family serine protease
MVRGRLRSCRPRLERLDDRCLLSDSGLTPAQVATAYGLSGLTLSGHAASGSGQTIALVDAYNDPNIAVELAVFDSSNNLPAPPSLTVVGQSGTAILPRTDPGWAQEESLDVEWAHALAPGASLVLVEAYSTNLSDLTAAVKTAAALPGVTVVSMSWGGGEVPYATSYDRTFTARGITFVAASGDSGPGSGAQWPASSPYVVGVGGTVLQVGAGGAYQGETAWPNSSGGYSTLEPEPGFQAAVQSSGWRSVPDVAFDADTNTGVEVYSMNPFNGQGVWYVAGGTSLGAPAWAGVVALADQGRALNNVASLGSLETLSALYSLPTADFHTLEGGYNTMTGLGSPNGAALVTGLVNFDASKTVASPPSSTPTPVTNGPVIGVPVIGLPVFSRPVVTQPVTSEPIVSTPTGNTPPVTQPGLTPPPAASPVNPQSRRLKTARNKHRPIHKSGHSRVKLYALPLAVASDTMNRG